jgi:hypothetical protein
MAVSLDPRKAHKALVIGDVLMILTWVNDERAMVLMPAHRAMGSPWFIIMESASYKYDEPRYLAQQAAKAAQIMGMDESTSTWVRVADIVMNYLPDLIRMPSSPTPEFHSGSFGTMTLMADGQAIRQEEIKVEKSGLEYA